MPASRTIAAALIAGGLVPLAFAGSAQATTFSGSNPWPITIGGDYDGQRVGTLVLHYSINDTNHQVRLGVRGSVQLGAGRWCVISSLLPRTSRREARSKTVDLAGTTSVRIPRLTNRPVGRLRWGDTITQEGARVRVLSGSCTGHEYARGSAYLGGG